MKSNTTIGMDLGDKSNEICVLDADGKVMTRDTVQNTKAALTKYFAKYAGAVVAVETGTHAGWVARELEGLGCEVLVGNARKLRMIWASGNKSDTRDAEMLARIARFDRSLLCPVSHRDEATQGDLAVLKARDMIVASRSALVNHVRGSVKATGHRVPKCGTDAFAKRARESVPESLRQALNPIIDEIEALGERIKGYDKLIMGEMTERHPDVEKLKQVPGVGPVTSMAFVLAIGDPTRFEKSRTIGAFLGLVPRRDQSGDTDKQLRITKTGNDFLRRLLVGCVHYILGPHGPDCELRRAGQELASHGGKNGKRKAVVAVARKLAVLLHRLWITGEKYDPEYTTSKRAAA